MKETHGRERRRERKKREGKERKRKLRGREGRGGMSSVFEVSELTILWDKKREELKRLRIPILVAGFKITGNAATYYLKESLSDVERAFRLYSHYFPPISMVSDDKFSIIHEELWLSRSKNYTFTGRRALRDCKDTEAFKVFRLK